MIKRLMLLTILFVVFSGCLEDNNSSMNSLMVGTAKADDLGREVLFESNSTTAVSDASIKGAAATTNYGTAVNLVVAGTSKKAVIRCEDCDDSLDERVFRVTSATLTLDVVGVNGTLSLDDSIGLYALLADDSARAYLEGSVTWNVRYGSVSWDAAGAGTSGIDYWATRIDAKSVSGWTALSSLPEFNIKMAFDSGKFGGFILAGINLEAGDSIKFASSEKTDEDETAPVFTIYAIEQNQVKSIFCNGGSGNYASGVYGVLLGEFTMLSYDAMLDSFDIDIYCSPVQGDSVFGVLYRNFAADSTFMEYSDDTIILNFSEGCHSIDLHFGMDSARSADRKICLADSSYIIGAYIGGVPAKASKTVWCITPDGPNDSGYFAGEPSYTSLVWDSRTAHGPCFRAYFQSLLGTIIIGKCESPETPYYNERTDQWSNMPL